MLFLKNFEVLKRQSNIAGDLDKVRSEISAQYDGPEDTQFRELVDYFQSRRGKMIRPMLLLLSASACGKIDKQHIKVAAIIEMIHNATLLHDDVIDEGCLRRNLPTINSLWGDETAVLLGDFILSRVFQKCTDLPKTVIKEISQATLRVCNGELRQIIHKKNWELSEAEYLKIIADKSASLFSCACKLGAVLAGGTYLETNALSEFGRKFGTAYQIKDDLIDLIGREEKSGKTLGSDLRKTKPTLPLIHFLNSLKGRRKEIFITELNEGRLEKDSLVEMLTSNKSLKYVGERAKELADQAQGSLDKIQESTAKETLVEITRGFVEIPT